MPVWNVLSLKSIFKVLSAVKSPPPDIPTPLIISLACNVSTLPSSVVIRVLTSVTLVEKLALSACKLSMLACSATIVVSKVVVLVEKLLLSAWRAATFSSSDAILSAKLWLFWVTLVEKLALSACKASTLASSVVIRVEKLPLSTCKASTLASSVVIRVEKLELGATNEPLISSDIWAEELNAPSNIPVNEVAFTLSSISILPNEAVVSNEPVYLLLNIAIK